MIDFASSHIVNLTLWLLVGFSVVAWAIILLKSWEQWSSAEYLAIAQHAGISQLSLQTWP